MSISSTLGLYGSASSITPTSERETQHGPLSASYTDPA